MVQRLGILRGLVFRLDVLQADELSIDLGLSTGAVEPRSTSSPAFLRSGGWQSQQEPGVFRDSFHQFVETHGYLADVLPYPPAVQERP